VNERESLYRWEWVAEVTDSDGEIVDIEHFDTFSDLVRFIDDWGAAAVDRPLTIDSEPCYLGDCGLVATGPDEGLPLADRSWAYLVGRSLPDETSGGIRSLKVPARFRREVEAAAD
jgi:hypothetical protein